MRYRDTGLGAKRTSADILFVGEDEEEGVFHLSVLDDALEFVLGFVHAVAVIAVDDKNQALRCLSVSMGCLPLQIRFCLKKSHG